MPSPSTAAIQTLQPGLEPELPAFETWYSTAFGAESFYHRTRSCMSACYIQNSSHICGFTSLVNQLNIKMNVLNLQPLNSKPKEIENYIKNLMSHLAD